MTQIRGSELRLVAGGLGALGTLVVVLAVVGDPGTPVGLLLGIAVVAYAGAVAGVMEEAKARTAQPAIRLVQAVPGTAAPAVVTVMAAQGVCALGYAVGGSWVMNSAGRLSRPLCQPALDALLPLLQGRGARAMAVQCACPLKRGALNFSVAGVPVP